jgi:hypothetical protein
MENIKWATIAAIAALVIATVMGWLWVWGLLYLYWAVAGAMTGNAFVIEIIERDRNPVLFWVINTLWTIAGVGTIAADLSGRLT